MIEPLRQALQPVYDALEIPLKQPSVLRAAAVAVLTVCELTAGLVPVVAIAWNMSAAIDKWVNRVYALHVFSMTRVEAIAKAGGAWGVALSNEIQRNERVPHMGRVGTAGGR